MILNEQKAIFNKVGLGFKPKKEQKLFKNFFVKASSNSSLNVTYFCCEKMGHKSNSYDFRKSNGSMVRKVWVSKGTIRTNPKGLKMT